MISKYITVFCFLACVSLKAQTDYTSGYILLNDGSKIEGLIENLDWLYNPQSIKFKSSEVSETKIYQANAILEFGLLSPKIVYKKHTVNVDQSSQKVSVMSDQLAPEYKKETVLLRLLVDGDKKLYNYTTNDRTLFFIQEGSENPAPLVYKIYQPKEAYVAYNYEFRQQLRNFLNCQNLKQTSFSKLKYTTEALVNLFNQYSNCSGALIDYTNLSTSALRFRVGPHLRLNSLTIEDSNVHEPGKKSTTSVGFAVGAEYVFGFNNNKWSVLADVTYFNVRSDMVVERTSTSFIFNRFINYNFEAQGVEIGLGPRHYFYLNKDSKLFLESQFMVSIPLSGQLVTTTTQDRTSELRTSTFLGLGTGVAYKSFELGVRYGINRSIISNTENKYSFISFAITYTF